MTDLPTAVAFDSANPILLRIADLLDVTSLGGLVAVTEREGWRPTARVTVLTPRRHVLTWSSGEQQLWRFIGSLAGGHTIDLRELAGRFGGGGDRDVENAIIACFLALWHKDAF